MYPALRPGVVSAPFADGGLLHDPRTGRLFILNASGAGLLNALRAGTRSNGDLDDLVRHGFGGVEIAERDVQAFLDGLRAADLLQPDDEPESTLLPVPASPEGRPALDAVFRIGDRRIRVVCHPPDIASTFAAIAAKARAGEGEPASTCLTLLAHDDAFVLLENDRVVDRLTSLRSARWALIREFVGEGRGRRWLALLHAGVVASPDGCLLLCGESGAGKSTLLAGLVQAGFPLVADDIAMQEEGTGLIWPTPLAISIKENSWPIIGPLFPKLAEAPVIRFGGRTMRYLQPDPGDLADDRGRPITAVLFVRHRPAGPTVLDPLDTRRALVLLGQGGSILPGTDDGLADFLQRWGTTPSFQFTYSRLDDAVGQLSALLSDGFRRAPLSSSAR